MWHQFWPSQHYKSVLLFGALLFSFNTIASLGVLDSVEEILEIHKQKFAAIYDSSALNTKKLLNNIEDKDIRINPIFMQSLLLYSSQKYVDLMKDNECHVYSLLSSGLLKTVRGSVGNIIVDIKAGDQKIETAQVSLEDYIKINTKLKCQNVGEVAKIFNLTNVKSTIKKISFPSPKTEKECKQVLQEWRQNSYLPYLCGIKEKLVVGRRVEQLKEKNRTSATINETLSWNRVLKEYNQLFEATSLYQRSYLASLCNHLDDDKAYCSLYLSSLVWDKVLSAEKPKSYMSYICKDTFAPKALDKTYMQLCRNKLATEPKACRTPTRMEFPYYLPQSSCNEISEALNDSRIQPDYPECPGLIDNESITHYNRLIEHFRPKKKDHSQSRCDHIAINNFAKMNIDFQNVTAWPMKVCYFDKFEDTEVCETYIPGADPDEELSEINMVSRIINKQISLPSSIKCKITSQEKYKPQFLEFKNGCFIVYDKNDCTLLNCKKKIFVNLKEIDLIRYEGIPSLEHIPSSFANEKFSQDNVLNESFKLASRRILNLTILKSFFETEDNRLVHGVGCLEDLLPRSFKRMGLQECTPHPFIIDGILDKKGDSFLIFRSSIESVHYPRLIRWQDVFNAVSNFKEIHPLRTWALLGIRRD